MAKIYYITGIDTGIGKTYATGMLARSLASHGKSVITAKLVQTGCSDISEDIILHRQLMGIELLPEDTDGTTCPYLFDLPASPHLAAQAEGKTIEPDIILNSIHKLSDKYDYILVEGAGGLLVPLTPGIQSIDIAASQNWPVIIVSSSRLGSINHTLMTIECAYNRNCTIAGIVYNVDNHTEPAIIKDSRDIIASSLGRYSNKPVVIDLPNIDTQNIPDIDFSDIFA